MASTQKVRLVVKDDDDVTVVDDEIDGSVNGDHIFNAMNSRCDFGLWERADAMGPGVLFTVMNSEYPWQNQAWAKQILQDIIQRLGLAGDPCEFTFQVRKMPEYGTNSDAPGGPLAPKNPGLGPRRHGPDLGGYETPAGPGASLARMRGTLARV